MSRGMNPVPRDKGVGSRMRQQKTSGTTPEMLLVDAIWRRGWRVLTVWEHVDPEVAADRVERFVRSTRTRRPR